MTCQNCDQPTVGKSKYCSTHRAEARAAFKAMLDDKKQATAERNTQFQQLINDLATVAETAYMACQPQPMMVYQTKGLSDIPDPNGSSWYVSEGVCGFGWVRITPATSSFAKWCAKNNIGYKAYDGGWILPVNYFMANISQSMERAEAAARAIVQELRKHNINCRAESRMD